MPIRTFQMKSNVVFCYFCDIISKKFCHLVIITKILFSFNSNIKLKKGYSCVLVIGQ